MILNLNYVLVFGLFSLIIVLIYILYIKYKSLPDPYFLPNNSTDLSKKNLPENIDFFNNGVKIIDKSNKIIDKKNNKIYQFIDMGDRVIIFENDYFEPTEINSQKKETIINSKNDVSFFLSSDERAYTPENQNSQIHEDILNDKNEHVKDEEEEIDYNTIHHELFDISTNDDNNIDEDTFNQDEDNDQNIFDSI